MTKAIKKYRSWFMAGFMVLLMLAWLGAPASRGIGEMRRSRTVGRLDGEKLSSEDVMNASKEIGAIDAIEPGISRIFGIEERDSTHWLLLSHEAEQLGLVGEEADGEDYVGMLARELIQADQNILFYLMQQGVKTREEGVVPVSNLIRRRMGSTGQMTQREANLTLAKMRGVERMLRAYRTAGRLSDREMATLAKRDLDAAVVDLVAIPASLSADQIPEPDAAALAAHFDKYKGTKPGEGENGIGYLLPRRVKLEWLVLSREAFEKAVDVDPIEMRKRYTQNHPGKYAGDFAVERANVEKDMRAEAADKAMQDAQLVVQSEVVKATRLLEVDGATKYKKLPADWDAKRPRFEAIAQAVAEEAKKGGLSLPLPTVVSKAANWQTEQDLVGLEGIGSSELHQGGIRKGFTEVIAWTRELEKAEPGLIPIQVNVPVGENYLQDQAGNRYYINVLAVRGESAPDSVADIKELATKDFKNLRAFEKLRDRLPEFRTAAATGGLDAVVALAMPATPIIADPAKKDDKKPEVRKGVRVNRLALGEPKLNEEPVRTAIVEAAAAFDPMAPYGSLDADKASLALAAPKGLCVGVFRIQAYAPLTKEDLRRAETNVINKAQRDEIATKAGSDEDPFSLPSLLRRHDYVSGTETIRTVDQLKRKDKTEG